jgi:hypothetical protein
MELLLVGATIGKGIDTITFQHGTKALLYMRLGMFLCNVNRHKAISDNRYALCVFSFNVYRHNDIVMTPILRDSGGTDGCCV